MTSTDKQQPLSSAFIKQVGERLSTDQAVSSELQAEGYLHVERQLPFLCVYRRPVSHDDEGTEKLLLGQAAYLLSMAEADQQQLVTELVQQIAETQLKRHEGFLIVELWASDDEVAEANGQPVQPFFHLHAPRHNIANDLLDAFENALQKIRLRRRQAGVKVSFADDCSAPGLPPLLTKDQQQALKYVVLGLEIKPVYRDPDSKTVLPFALRALRHGITHALKKGFYHFSHHQTHYRPAHYHELGSRALTKVVWDVDRRLAKISECFDLLLHVTPVNAAEAWQVFEQSGYGDVPEFHYRPRSADPALLKRELYRVPIEHIEDPTLADLFASKRDELDRQISLLNDRNSPQFLHGSIQLFGQLDDSLLQAAGKIMAAGDAQVADESGVILDAEEFAQRARDELDYYRQIDPTLAARVEVRDDVTGILVSHGNFLIARDAHVSQARLAATLNHEIGTHVLTYHNGKQQPFQQFYAGTAGYEELQEGLAVFSEYLSGGLGLPRLQQLAGRVIAVHSLISGVNFIETFNLLQDEYGLHPFTAFTTTMRVYRGGGYTKDMIYLRGFIRLLDYLVKGGELELLYYGKVSMEHLHLLEELRWREVLKPVALMPRFIDSPDAQQRLARVKSGLSMEQMIEVL